MRYVPFGPILMRRREKRGACPAFASICSNGIAKTPDKPKNREPFVMRTLMCFIFRYRSSNVYEVSSFPRALTLRRGFSRTAHSRRRKDDTPTRDARTTAKRERHRPRMAPQTRPTPGHAPVKPSHRAGLGRGQARARRNSDCGSAEHPPRR